MATPASSIVVARCVVGIDPGLEGGVAILELDARGVIVGHELHRTPTILVRRRTRSRREYDVRAMWRLLRGAIDAHRPPSLPMEIVIEAAGARPRQGVTSTFRTGLGAGLWLALAVASEIPYRIVPPQVWKASFALLGASKSASRLRVSEIVPSVGVLRPADEGPAEALLIAAYVARRPPAIAEPAA